MPQCPKQQGLTLVELLVGMALGLLVIAVALGALLVSRGISTTVSDTSQLQQQAAYLMRVIGQQVRQAGSLHLNLAAQKAATESIEATDPVAFETRTQNFDPVQHTIRGIDTPGTNQYKLALGHAYDQAATYLGDALADQSRNCLGESGSAGLILSRFVLHTATHELRCAGGSSSAQALAQNVADFQVRYMLQAAHGTPKIQYASASAVGNDWSRVFGISICIVLFGTQPIDMPSGQKYTGCPAADGSTAEIDMTTLAQPRQRRMHKTFRSVYLLRSQGLPG